MAYRSYAERLKDPRWQRRRLECLQAADWKCSSCRTTERTLHVHHKLYRRGAEPWEYEDHELAVLCENCHEARHRIGHEIQEALADLPIFELERALGYAQTLLVNLGERETVPDVSGAREIGVLDALSGYSGGWRRFEEILRIITRFNGGNHLSADQVKAIRNTLERTELAMVQE